MTSRGPSQATGASATPGSSQPSGSGTSGRVPKEDRDFPAKTGTNYDSTEGKHRDSPYYFIVGNQQMQGVLFSLDKSYRMKTEEAIVYYLRCKTTNCNGRAQIRGDTLLLDTKTTHCCLAKPVADRLAEVEVLVIKNKLKHLARTTSEDPKVSEEML